MKSALLWAVLKWLHSPKCRLSKNGRLVAVAIAWHRGVKATLKDLSKETGLGRTATMTAITEACGVGGIFDVKRRAPGRANVYRLKSDGNPSFMSDGNPTLKSDGKQGLMTGGRVPDIRTQKRTSTSTGRNAELPHEPGRDRTAPVTREGRFPVAGSSDLAARVRRVQSIEERMRRIS